MAEQDSTAVNTRSRARALLFLARKLQKTPGRVASKVATAAVKDPVATAEAIGKATAKTVSVSLSPSLWLLQQMGLRTTSGLAGAAEPLIEMVKEKPLAGASTREQLVQSSGDVAKGLAKSAAGFYKGALSKEIEAPEGTNPATALSDVFRRQGYPQGYKYEEGQEEALFNVPKPLRRPLLKATEFVSGPDFPAFGTEFFAGDVLTLGAGKVRKGAQAIGVGKNLSPAVEQLRQAPGIRNVIRTFQPEGRIPKRVVDPVSGKVLSENAREEFKYLTQMKAGERGALVQAFSDQVPNGKTIIEKSAKQFGMDPTDRAKYLETVYENQAKHGPGGLKEAFDARMITRDELGFLEKLGRFYKYTVPPTRQRVGAKAHFLYETADKAANRALDNIHKVKTLARDLEAMKAGTYPRVTTEDGVTAITSEGVGVYANPLQETRRKLIKAIRDAYWSTRNFSRVSRHAIDPPKIDIDNIHTMTNEELLGITEKLTQKEMIEKGITAFDPELVAKKKFVGVIRNRTRGEQVTPELQMRVFNEHGREVSRFPVPSTGEASILLREKFGSQETTDFIVQKGKAWRGEQKVRGPMPSPLKRFEQIEKEILDRDKYFMSYLPRYESEDLAKAAAPLRAGKKRGISTSLGGARITAPTTTQEQARQILRDKFVRESREANLGGKIKEIKEPIQDISQAFQTHVERNADAISKANFLNRVRLKFGIQAPDDVTRKALEAEGWVPLGKLKGTKSGFSREYAQAFDDSYVPQSVFDTVSALDEVLSPKTRTGFSKFAHELLNREKAYLTVVNPRFTIRNRIWEVYASYARGNRNLKNWADADEILTGLDPSRKIDGLGMTVGEARKVLRQQGVMGQDIGVGSEIVGRKSLKIEDPLMSKNLRGERMRTAVKRLDQTAEDVVRAASDLNMQGEMKSRVAHWLWAKRDQKMDWMKARQEVATTMFDYNKDFYTINEAQLKEWIPFYSWFRRIVPLSARVVVESPGEFAKMGALQVHTNAMNGVAPEEMEYLGRAYLNSYGLVLPDKPDQMPGTKQVANLPYGFSDPSQFMSLSEDLGPVSPLGELTGPIRAAANVVRPSIQLPLSFIYAQSVSGEKFDDHITKLPGMYLALPKPAQERLGIRIGADGQAYGPATLIPLMRYLQGGWGEALGGAISANPRAKANFFAWLSGIKVDPEVPVAQNRSQRAASKFMSMEERYQRMISGTRRLGKVAAQESQRKRLQETAP